MLTSGGDAPGMNAALRAVVRKGIFNNCEVLGYREGFRGIINDDIIPLQLGSVADVIQKGGTFLRTARCDEFKTNCGIATALANLRRREIDALIVIGGDGSARGAKALNDRGITAVVVPGTIDNDIPATAMTIGFDTAINTASAAIDKIRDTATSHQRTFIVELMGRHSGAIALAAGLAGGAESIIVPELPYDLGEICRRIESGRARGKLHSIILVAEGVASAYDVADYVKDSTDQDTRVIVLGHLQRGGSPTAFDRILASRMASLAVDLVLAGNGGKLVALQNGRYTYMDIAAALELPATFDNEAFVLAKILSI